MVLLASEAHMHSVQKWLGEAIEKELGSMYFEQSRAQAEEDMLRDIPTAWLYQSHGEV